jgi:23S rRNA (adenine-N6)-dimethyltransferase
VDARRPWGWHRLDPDWAERIVADAAIRPGELVVDLGAGVGPLTLPLLEAGGRVIAVELHPTRARRLQEKVSGRAAAVVECDLEDFVAVTAAEEVANIPRNQHLTLRTPRDQDRAQLAKQGAVPRAGVERKNLETWESPKSP